ncbi:MAG TPA: orotidine 5'-phosphate decarboxylase / HUMPS family protein, partial [Terriglobia bacterium]|nr:orotidine 5'-phosphate decarboxylase / HUMPS family protein [Terriglobia bacterium]
EIGVAGGAEEAVIRLAHLARDAGLDGVVASPREIASLRRALGRDFVVVTPGIRPAAAATGDQVRVATPAAAVQAGADFLVVGRPITSVPDPVKAADTIVAEMENALRSDTGVH